MKTDNYDKLFKGVLSGLLIAAVVGLLALYGTVKANTTRLDNVEPIVKSTASDISDIKGDIRAIRVALEYEQKRERMAK